MRTLFFLCLALMTSCASVAHVEQPPALGSYLISQFSVDGVRLKTWEVSTFTEDQLSQILSFRTAEGRQVTLKGSYQIDEFTP